MKDVEVILQVLSSLVVARKICKMLKLDGLPQTIKLAVHVVQVVTTRLV